MNDLKAAEAEVSRLETLVAEASRDRRELLRGTEPPAPPPQQQQQPSGP
jgi:hypothetical protein